MGENDINKIPNTLRSIIESVNKLAKNMVEPIMESQRQLMRIAEERSALINDVINDFVKRLLDEVELSSDQVAPLLEEANFWLPFSMDYILLEKLVAEIESENPTPDEVKKVFIHHYGENNWKRLTEMIDGWKDNPTFSNRMEIINDALKAHKQGLYTLVIPTMLCQFEGIASSVLSSSAGESTTLAKQAIKSSNARFGQAASKDILIRKITSPFAFGGTPKDSGVFTADQYSGWLESKGYDGEDSINRHGILHGVHLDYASRANSLRVFLLLDSLNHIGIMS